eukprot:351823-Amphidinium_carterae.2
MLLRQLGPHASLIQRRAVAQKSNRQLCQLHFTITPMVPEGLSEHFPQTDYPYESQPCFITFSRSSVNCALNPSQKEWVVLIVA